MFSAIIQSYEGRSRWRNYLSVAKIYDLCSIGESAYIPLIHFFFLFILNSRSYSNIYISLKGI